MIETKFTPGPWALKSVDHDITISNWSITIGDYAVSLFPYRRIYSQDRTKSGFVIDNQKMADSHLIAAAPDLYEALADFPGFSCGTNQAEMWLVNMRKALAKARGEPC